MLGGNLGSLLYRDVSLMIAIKAHCYRLTTSKTDETGFTGFLFVFVVVLGGCQASAYILT